MERQEKYNWITIRKKYSMQIAIAFVKWGMLYRVGRYGHFTTKTIGFVD